MKHLLLASLAALALTLPALAAATTIYIDDDAPNDPGPGDPTVSDPLEDGSSDHPFDAIQEGIDAAVDTDTVLVLDGTYTGTGNRDLDFGGKAITVQSENGPETCIIDCEQRGRGFYFHSGETVASIVEGFTICHGSGSDVGGGGVYCKESDPVVSECVIVGSGTAYYGGGIYTEDCSPTIRDCVVTGNLCNRRGGGIYCHCGSPEITGCTITSNVAEDGPGGLYCVGSPVVRSCVIAGNSVGGIACSGDSIPTIANCTMVGNTHYAVSAGSDAAIVNCIVWANIGRQVVGSPTLTHCIVEGGWDGAGSDNLDGNPLLRHDYHIASTSPCIDAGDPSGAYAGQFDMDGEPRVANGVVDIGADEFTDNDGDGLPDWWEDQFYSDASADPDGDGVANGGEYDHGCDPDDGDTDDDSRSDSVEVADSTNPVHADNPDKTYYVNGTSGDDAWDGLAASYDGVHGPKQTIQAGIDATITGWGYAVQVAPGTYVGLGNRGLDLGGRAITLRSEDGPATTIVDCEDADHGFHFHTDERPTSIVDGLTIQHGHGGTLGGGGVYCEGYSSPTITNCVISGSTAVYAGGGVFDDGSGTPTISNCLIVGNVSYRSGGGLAGSPNVVNCVIRDNHAEDYGGGTDGSGTFTNCLIVCNAAAEGGGVHGGAPTLRNCTIVGNKAQLGGGLYVYGSTSSPTLVNCIIWGNSAEQIRGTPENIRADYCDIQGGWTGAGANNLAADPLFGPSYHIRSDSPCVNAGDPGGTYADQLDMDGEARVADGLVDIGADEFADSDGDGLPDWWELVHYTDPFGDPDGDGLTNLGEYEQGADPDDSDTDDDGRTDGEEAAAGTNLVHPDNPEKTYYVNDSAGDDAWDGLAASYDGIHGPKKTIQAGIDATISGWDYTVLVAPGTYAGDGNKHLDFGGRAIALRSEEGPATTIIDSERNGRGVHFHTGERQTSVLEGFTVRNGGPYWDGGGILCLNASPTIVNCVIADNSAADWGGGIYCENYSNPTITGCLITRNVVAGFYGGGICVAGPGGGSPTISNCVISFNYSEECDGAGIYCGGSARLTLTNSIILGNVTGGRWGGAVVLAGPGTISNCTIVDNIAQRCGGICIVDDDTTLRNCILWNNSGQQIVIRGGSTELHHCDVQGGWSGTGSGNIDVNPLLRADNRLQPGSPCIDAGDPGGMYTDQLDIDGETRVADGVVDIGADEFVDTDADGLPDWWEARYHADAAADPDGDGLANLDEYASSSDPDVVDTDGDGRDDAQENLDATCAYHPDDAQKTYHVSDSAGDDTYDGLAPTWDGLHGPKRTIQAGIDATITGWGYTVLVSDGVYMGIGNRSLVFGGKAVTLRSQHGPEQTVIDCESYTRGFYICSGEGASTVIEGFTIRNGRGGTAGGGAFHCEGSQPTIRHCVITECGATYSGGGVMCDDANPTIDRCHIVANSVYYHEGGGITCGGDSCPTITSCVIADNSVPEGNGGGLYCGPHTQPMIVNCTIAGNEAERGGGIYVGGSSPAGTTVINSIVWGNTSLNNPGEQIAGILTANYSDVQGGWAGTGNIKTDPSFVDAPSGDYHLNASSPCIDAGRSNGAPALDIDDESRWDDLSVPNTGGGAMPYYDIGADEYVSLEPDADADGLPDYWELLHGLDPYDDGSVDPNNGPVGDPDGDGLTNIEEFQHGLNPNSPDQDNDGLNDGDEIHVHATDPFDPDSDDDALSDGNEVNTHGTDPLDADSDDDGLTDGNEINTYATDPLDGDSDDDGLSDGDEVNSHGTDPLDADSDDDGLSDGDEVNVHGTDPQDGDTDDDGLDDGDEVNVYGTDPLDADTDDDTMPDGWEVDNGLDPADAADGTLDADGDWLLNVEEYGFGSDPQDPASPAFIYVDDDAAGNPVQDGTLAHPYEAIQLAINAAAPPAVVKVLAGTYNEAIVIPDGVWVIGPGAASATINAGNTAHAVEFVDAGEGLLAGFAVTAGGTGYQGLKTTGLSSPTIRNCTFTDSRSGLALAGDGAPCVVNCLIAGNPYQGIFTGGTATPTIINCTIADNDANGIVKWGSGHITITNSILWGNADDINGAAEDFTVSYCDIGDGDFAGTDGNISADPLFFNEAAGNYRLLAGSPCIDAGTSNGTPSLDLAGTSRWDDPDVANTGGGDLPWYDIGAYEYAFDCDVDGDDDVDIDDLVLVYDGLGTDDPALDIDGDGLVTFADLRLVYEHIPPDGRDFGGVPTLWALDYMDPTDPNAQGLDPTQDESQLDNDGDGRTNYAEYVAGTDPTDSTSRFEVTAVARGPALEINHIAVSWTIVPGKSYQLYCADTPGDGADWQPLEGTYEINDGIATQHIELDPDQKRLFFKVEVW